MKTGDKMAEYKANFYDLQSKILEWADVRGILDGSTPEKQAAKTQEELDETIAAIRVRNQNEIVDGIGDMIVTIIILAALNGVTVTECLNAAWDEIKNRKGKMVDGVFVKEKDLTLSDVDGIL